MLRSRVAEDRRATAERAAAGGGGSAAAATTGGGGRRATAPRGDDARAGDLYHDVAVSREGEWDGPSMDAAPPSGAGALDAGDSVAAAVARSEALSERLLRLRLDVVARRTLVQRQQQGTNDNAARAAARRRPVSAGGDSDGGASRPISPPPSASNQQQRALPPPFAFASFETPPMASWRGLGM